MQNDISLMVSRTTQSSHIDYNVGPEDVLEVLVWKNEALSKVVIVRPDGKISLPLVGDVQAAGRSALQIKDDITQQLKPFYKEPPQVSVIVQQANSYVISILGEVQRPSQYVVKRDTTLLQAIALAGGFTPFASLNEIILLRRDNDNLKQLATQIRYKDIISGKYLDNNIFLQADDTIIVP
jgi:polysaccharide export outer membrane protein